MTPAELRTLREGLGLTLADVATLGSVQLRTAQRWEEGVSAVPKEVAQALRSLDSVVERALREAVAQVARCDPPPAQVALLRYRSDDDLARADPVMAERFQPAPAKVHGMMIGRLSRALQADGIEVRIVGFDRETYAAWRRREKLPDRSDTRAAWAAVQV